MTALGMWRLLRLAILLAICLTGWRVGSLFGRGDFWVQLFLRRVGHVLGLRVTVEGSALDRDVLFVANHISWLDILALGGATRARFVGKAEIRDWTLVGRLATVGGIVYISRERRSQTRAQADEVARALAEGRPVALFGEGATGDGVTLAPFRPPLFVAAAEAGAMVQPVAVDYGPGRARYAWGDTRFSDEMKKLLNRAEIVPVTLRFLPPLDPHMMGRKALAEASRMAIAGALV